MDHDARNGTGNARDEGMSHTSTAVNAKYAAYASGNQIEILEIASRREWCLDGYSHRHSSGSSLPLAFSYQRPELLAIARGSDVLVFDVASNDLIQTISAGGRTITSLAWSLHEANTLATGSAAGKVCIWNIDQPKKPLHQFGGARVSCSTLVFNPVDNDILASIHGDQIRIWAVLPSPKLLATLPASGIKFKTAIWHPKVAGRLLSCTVRGELVFYSCANAIKAVRKLQAVAAGETTEDEMAMIWADCDRDVEPIFRHILRDMCIQLAWLTDFDVLALVGPGQGTSVCQLRLQDNHEPALVWTRALDHDIAAMQLGPTMRSLMLLRSYDCSVEFVPIPSSTLDAIALDNEHSWTQRSSSSLSMISVQSVLSANHADHRTQHPSHMRPSKITRSDGQNGVQKNSPPVQAGLSSMRSRKIQRTSRYADSAKNSTSTTVHKSTSAIDSAGSEQGNQGSPIPFLSPGIPSRRTSSHSLPPIDESTVLPPLLHPSFSTSMPSTAADHDSDSDDDTFAAALSGSGMLLPGGVHVPLPKACGALFGPSGHLLIYFPPRPRPLSALPAELSENKVDKQENFATRIARLFPNFGNLLSDDLVKVTDLESDSSSESAHGNAVEPLHLVDSFQFPSFQSQQAWNPATLPTKDNLEHKIIIRVSEMADVTSLLSEQRHLACQYRTLCGNKETGTQLCNHNSVAAREAGRHDVSNVWELLGMLLDEKVPLELLRMSADQVEALVINRQAQALTRSDSGVDVMQINRRSSSYGVLRWTEHPFGGTWLIRQLLAWAERAGDIQMLACMCALLTRPQHPTSRGERSIVTKLPSYTMDYTAKVSLLSGINVANSVPVFRANTSVASPFAADSPVKMGRSESGNNSRNQSQPVTPHFDSPSNTSASFAWPSLSRQGTRHSGTPGTASTTAFSSTYSPELARGSFSAAAKYYAQTITDKFADRFGAYGTSPPRHRSSLSKPSSSPRNTDQLSSLLSSSLPRGSLSKSVSFASTTDTMVGGRLSRSYEGQDDSHRVVEEDEGYESDRTVARSSVTTALSPRVVRDDVIVTLKNQSAFVDELSGCVKASLIPADLTHRSLMWIEHYAEQLRTWCLWDKAADLDKIANLIREPDEEPESGVDDELDPVPYEIALQPQPRGNRRESARDIRLLCSICATAEHGVQQTCPSCLHTSHLFCLEAYAEAVYVPASAGADSPSTPADQITFTCPTGCGCTCADLAFIAPAVVGAVHARDDRIPDADAERKRANSVRTVVKKASFTDPRRWRARVEGDSW